MTRVEALREAARILRDEPGEFDPSLMLPLVAQWLDAEAATLSAMEPLTNLFNMAIKQSGGPESFLRLGRRPDGRIAMEADTGQPAEVLARAVIGAAS